MTPQTTHSLKEGYIAAMMAYHGVSSIEGLIRATADEFEKEADGLGGDCWVPREAQFALEQLIVNTIRRIDQP